jgi:hypothetical protein
MATRKSSFHSRSRARGAASVEAVVVLPFFVLLFISLFYVRDQVLTRQAAQERARTCAWLYSNNSCDKGQLPPECQDVVKDVPLAADAAKTVTDKLTGDGFFQDVVSGLIDSALETAFGSAFDVKVEREVARPAIYGGKTQAIVGEYHLACNLKPKTKIDVAKDAWSRVNPFK